MRKKKPMARRIQKTESKTRVICEGIGLVICGALLIWIVEVILL